VLASIGPFAHTDQYLQYGLFTARVLPMILLHPQLTHPSFEATIAFGRFVQHIFNFKVA
jgi:hypothetical protein